MKCIVGFYWIDRENRCVSLLLFVGFVVECVLGGGGIINRWLGNEFKVMLFL